MREPLNPNHVLRQKLNYFYSNFIDNEPEALRCQVSYPSHTACKQEKGRRSAPDGGVRRGQESEWCK